jgi:recombination endonuclease VII
VTIEEKLARNREAVRRYRAKPGIADKQRQAALDWYYANRERALANKRVWSATPRGKECRRLADHKRQIAGRRRVVDLRKTLKAKYGLTLEAYGAMVEQQNGVCAICQESPRGHRLDVDHDHTTGRVRGLLCDRCNRMLGQGRENPALLEAGVRYLRSFNV